jgi:hypothetical protein
MRRAPAGDLYDLAYGPRPTTRRRTREWDESLGEFALVPDNWPRGPFVPTPKEESQKRRRAAAARRYRSRWLLSCSPEPHEWFPCWDIHPPLVRALPDGHIVLGPFCPTKLPQTAQELGRWARKHVRRKVAGTDGYRVALVRRETTDHHGYTFDWVHVEMEPK